MVRSPQSKRPRSKRAPPAPETGDGNPPPPGDPTPTPDPTPAPDPDTKTSDPAGDPAKPGEQHGEETTHRATGNAGEAPSATDTELLDRLAALTRAVQLQSEAIGNLATKENEIVARVNEHHEFLAALKGRIQERQASEGGAPAAGTPASPGAGGFPLGIPAGAAPQGQGFNDPQAQKAADLMKLAKTGMDFLEGAGGGGAAAGGIDYGRLLAQATLERMTKENGLIDALTAGFRQGLTRQAAAVTRGALPEFQ